MSVLIDGGYIAHFRFYATVQWWRLAKPTLEIEDNIESFKNAYNERFCKCLNDFLQKNNLVGQQVILASDPPTRNLWRSRLFEDYKGGRQVKDSVKTAMYACFDRNNLSSLCESSGIKLVGHPELEADDCIAILIKQLLVPTPITVITSDHDYLQLCSQDVRLLTLKGTILEPTVSPQISLASKIIGGDKSDNIPSLFSRCGPKTAQMLALHPDKLEAKVARLTPEEKQVYESRLALNTQLIDFNRIPSQLVTEFQSSLSE